MEEKVMRLIEVTATTQVVSDEIRDRMHSKAQYTRHYVLRDGQIEIGFLSLDPIPDRDYLTLYEVFVPKTHRHKGIGSELLHHCEMLATEWGYKSVVVWPKPFERDFPKVKLVQWYKRHGFDEWKLNRDNLEKKVKYRSELNNHEL